MQTPQSLDHAMALLKAKEAKVSTTFHAVVGSRWLMAILATACLGFGLHALYAPSWLPSLSGVSLAALGLPDGADFTDFGALSYKLNQAASSHGGQLLVGQAQTYVDDHAALINQIGFGVCLVLLLVNMTIMTERRSFTRG